MALLTRTQLSMLAGLLYHQECANNLQNEEKKLSVELQQCFLQASHRFVSTGMKKLCSSVQYVVECSTSSLALTDKLSLSDLEILFKDIFDVYKLESSGVMEDPAAYFLDQEEDFEGISEDDQIQLKLMLADCVDILNNDDTKFMTEQVSVQGLSHILDRVAEYFTTSEAGGSPSPQKHPGKNIETVDSESDSDSGFVSPVSVFLPVAKLIPILTTQVRLRIDEADMWSGHLQDCPSLRSLGANIYEAYCETNQVCNTDYQDWGAALYNTLTKFAQMT